MKTELSAGAAEEQLSPSPSIQNQNGNDVHVVVSNTGYVLFIENDPVTRLSLIGYFEEHNVPACAITGQRELNRHFANSNLSLIILDLCAGEDDGLALLRDIRSRSDVPIIITAGGRCDEIDRVVALELGADDYVTKPISSRELLARARAVLRRQKIGETTRARDPERGGFRFSGWHLDRRTRRFLDPKGNLVPLTKGEYALLVAFLEAPQRPLSREQLLHATRIYEDVFDRSIDVQVLRLRRKLETDPNAPRIIKTERGVGYLFAPSVEPF
ncbi:winged helix-turn-helix domain-containing protein [Bradyrhizobium sp. SYSU BS000235]|uniref:winged helix-turn-helix domain-containing protein n=1 Tax=Bradyrhizobium sp. SYSU BS000235 TaxID=3411332 RepID=UPI003C724968